MKNSLYIVIALLLLCSCENRYEKQDVVGDWVSDNIHYIIHLYDNDSCLITNYPLSELYKNEKWRSEKERNDTTCIEIEIKARWGIPSNYNIVRIYTNSFGPHGPGWGLKIDKGIFFWRKSTWKLYYTTMDEDEYITKHTFSRQ